MKAADDRYPRLTPVLCEVVGLENQAARALNRAEHGHCRVPQDVEVAQCSDECRRLLAEMYFQRRRIAWIVLPEVSDGYFPPLTPSSPSEFVGALLCSLAAFWRCFKIWEHSCQNVNSSSFVIRPIFARIFAAPRCFISTHSNVFIFILDHLQG